MPLGFGDVKGNEGIAMGSFLPRTDAGLLAWANNFIAVVEPVVTTYGLVAADITAFQTLTDAYQTALAACAPGQRSKGAVAGKNQAKTDLKAKARLLSDRVQGTAGVTDQMKIDAGLNVKAQPAPVPPPAVAPRVTVKNVVDRMATYWISDATVEGRRRRPPNADGATIMSFVGETPPPKGDAGWKLEGQTGRTNFTVQYGNDVQPGAACWVSCIWYNKRGGYSPACDPVRTFLQIGPAAETA
jgi:hypothetical protein